MENGTAGGQTEAPPRKPKLTRLKIERFRNVEPCELRFGDGFNVLLGLNASGKTTLLELIAAALSFDFFSRFRNEPFALEYELSFSSGTILVLMRSERVERRVHEGALHRLRDAEGFSLSARLQIGSTAVCANASSIWMEDSPDLKIPLPQELGERGLGLLLLAADISANKSVMDAWGADLWKWQDVRRFDEVLDYFRDISRPSTWIEAWIHTGEKFALGFNVGGVASQELCVAVGAQAVNALPDSQGLTIPSASLRFLRDIGALFGFKDARLEMRLESKSKRGATSEGLRFSDLRFMFEDHDGSIIRHDDLSYGQKRLLAFYYYLAASPLTVIADELVDGLHHRWIDAAIEAIGDRQAFLASQNPLLLDHLEFDSAEQVASTFIICRTERQGDDKRMIWSNLSDYDAERFFRAYQVDVKHVSEILLSKGLW